jgi:GNAT superfamily N-acetyltransferase
VADLAVVLRDAAAGRFPPPDGAISVLPSPGGSADALLALTSHFVLAAPIREADVRARTAGADLSLPMSPPFLAWVAERTGSRPATHDVLLVADPAPGAGGPPLEPLDGSSHPRVARAGRYRHDLRVWTTPGGEGIVVLGRGLAGRLEVAFEVEPAARGAGLGRALAAAARHLAPPDEPLWAQVAPGNAASLRAVLAAGFRPVGAEVLFPRVASPHG